MHRIGRTGRAGAKGVGVTLVAPTEHRDVDRLVTTLGLEHGLGTPDGRQHRAAPSTHAPRKPAPHRPHGGPAAGATAVAETGGARPQTSGPGMDRVDADAVDDLGTGIGVRGERPPFFSLCLRDAEPARVRCLNP